MPRVKRRAYYQKRPRWCKHILLVGLNSTSTQTSVLASNSSAVASPTPSLVTAGNFTLRGDITLPSASIAANSYCFIIIAYIPEGVEVNNNTAIGGWFEKHPEYVLAWKPIPLPEGTEGSDAAAAVFIMSSKMKRNLNSGDSIKAMIYSNVGAIKFNGACEFYTKV